MHIHLYVGLYVHAVGVHTPHPPTSPLSFHTQEILLNGPSYQRSLTQQHFPTVCEWRALSQSQTAAAAWRVCVVVLWHCWMVVGGDVYGGGVFGVVVVFLW